MGDRGSRGQSKLHLHLTTPLCPLSDDLIAALTRAQAEAGLPGVGLHVDDCRKTYQELTDKGVDFIQEPQERPVRCGKRTRANNSGNPAALVEPRNSRTLADFEGADPH